MNVTIVKDDDINSWLELIREVEPLFGPMASDAHFLQAIKDVIIQQEAFCIRETANVLCGVIVISKAKNEIEWFAVAKEERKKGYGSILLKHAIAQLDPNRPITVQTFAEDTPEGLGARKLYLKAGFTEIQKAGPNPAGISTVIMKLDANKCGQL